MGARMFDPTFILERFKKRQKKEKNGILFIIYW